MSADSYFTSKSGEYNFDMNKIGLAHQDCFGQFIKALSTTRPRDLLVVDNTNTRLWECSPYVLAGETFMHDVKLIRFNVVSGLAAVAARNSHGVPEAAVISMHERMEPALPHWSEEVIEVSL